MPFFISNPIKRVCRDVTHPVEFLGNQVLGKVYFAAGIASVAFNLVTTVAGVPFRSAKQNTQIYESYKNIAYNFMSKVANSDAFTIGEFIGDYLEGAAVGVGYGYALKAAKPLAIKHVRHFKNIKQSVCTVAEKSTEYMDELRKLGGKIKQDFKDDFNHWLGKQEVAVTPEGMLVKVPSQKPKADGLVMKMGKPTGQEKYKGGRFEKTGKNVDVASQFQKLSKLITELNKKFRNVRDGYGELEGKKISFIYEHVLQPDMTRVGNRTGWHHDSLGFFEKARRFMGREIEIHGSKVKGPYGTYQLNWGYAGQRPKPSTFFPQSWTPETVLNKVVEAYDYCRNKKIMPRRLDNGNYLLIGKSDNEFPIKMIINSLGEMITAFPDFK